VEQDLLARMTLDTTVKVGFGVDLGCLAPSMPHVPVAKSYEEASACSFNRFVDPLWRIKRFLQVGKEKQLKQAVKTLDDFAYDVIRRRRAELPEGKGMEKVNEVFKASNNILANDDSKIDIPLFLTCLCLYMCSTTLVPMELSGHADSKSAVSSRSLTLSRWLLSPDHRIYPSTTMHLPRQNYTNINTLCQFVSCYIIILNPL
jgi:hypothetical protein